MFETKYSKSMKASARKPRTMKFANGGSVDGGATPTEKNRDEEGGSTPRSEAYRKPTRDNRFMRDDGTSPKE